MLGPRVLGMVTISADVMLHGLCLWDLGQDSHAGPGETRTGFAGALLLQLVSILKLETMKD